MLRQAPVSFFVVSAFVFFAGLACGGAYAKPAPTVPAPTPIAAEPTKEPIDRSAVPIPDGLLVVGRVSNPDGVVKAVGSWAHLPLPGGRELVRSITDDVVADAVDLSQPVDGAMMLAGMGIRIKAL